MDQRVIYTPGRDGFLAYWRIHHWCTCCSGESRQGLRTAVMTPDPVKRDEDVPAAIEKWEKAVRELELRPDEEKLPDSYTMTALTKLLPKDGEIWKKVQDLEHENEMKKGRPGSDHKNFK